MAGKSISRQNFAPESENGINKQIGLELSASYTYMSMACYFDRDDVALKGFYKYFKKRSDEERYYAKKVNLFVERFWSYIYLCTLFIFRIAHLYSSCTLINNIVLCTQLDSS